MELLPNIIPEKRYDIALSIDSEELAQQAQMLIQSVVKQIMNEDIFDFKKDIIDRARIVTSDSDYKNKYSPIMVFIPGHMLAPKYNYVYLSIKIFYTLTDTKYIVGQHRHLYSKLIYHANLVLSWATERSYLAVTHPLASAKLDFAIHKMGNSSQTPAIVQKPNYKYDFLYLTKKEDYKLTDAIQQMCQEDKDENIKESSSIKDDDRWFAFKPRKIVSETVSMQIRKETFDYTHLSERFLHKALETMNYLLANRFLDLKKINTDKGDSIRFQSCKNDFYLGVKSVFINIDIRLNTNMKVKSPFIIEFSWTDSLSEFTQKHEIVNVYGGLNSSDHFYIGELKKD